MSLTHEKKLKLKLDVRAWNKIRNEYGTQLNEEIVEKLIEDHFTSKRIIQENERMKSENENILEKELKLESEISKYQKKNRKLKHAIKRYKKRYLHQKKIDQSLRDELDHYDQQPMIEEKIVYKEDDTTINALREKRDRLIEKNHHYIDQVKDLEHYKEQFDELRQVVDDWKRHNFAVMYQNGTSTDRSQKNSLKIIDSKTYFEYKANPEMFKKKYKLNNSIVVKEIPYSIV